MTNTDIRILCSARIKLTTEQREALKAAYRQEQQKNLTPHRSVIPGSGIRVENAPVQSDINNRLGMPHIVVIDLLASRESLSLPMALLFQRELGVDIVNDDELRKAFDSYLNHIHTNVLP